MAKRGYLEPKVSTPGLDRKKVNGQFVNPPSYMEMGGFTGASKLKGNTSGNMNLQGSPKAKQGKPI